MEGGGAIPHRLLECVNSSNRVFQLKEERAMRTNFTRAFVIGAVALAFVVTNAVAGGPYGKAPIFPLAKKEGFNTLTKAVQAVGLQKTLTVDGPFTVFAPTDEAFAALPPGTLEFLLENPEQLKQILLYHVVEGEVPAAVVVGLTSATTLNGADISISVNGGVVLNGDTNVILTDVFAKNGVIHVIDKVLLPPGM
jgi:uncharacterized surface protein with fasciclin (FAS1) repeats